MIDEQGIENEVLTNHAARAPHTEDPVHTDIDSALQQGKTDHSASPRSARCKLNTVEAEEEEGSNATSKYTVNRIIRHVVTGNNIE